MKRSSPYKFTVPMLVVAISTLLALVPGDGLAATPPVFLPATYFNSGASGTESAVAADVDGDGHRDLIVAIQNHSFGGGSDGLVAVLFGNGDGTFQPPVTYDSAGGAPFSLAVADLNGDGAPDIVVDNFCVWVSGSCSFTTVGVLLNHGDGTFAPAVPWSLGGNSSQSIAIADVNEDGKPDLLATVFLPFNGGVAILLGNGDGTFQPPINAVLGPIDLRSIAVADINQDGHLDVVVTGSDTSVSPSRGTVTILLGNGNGTFQPPLATYDSGVTPGGWANSVAVADVNGDGALDLAVANYPDSTTGVFLGNGDGSFQPVALHDSGAPFAWFAAIADVNGDSDPDLIVANFAGVLGVLVGNGDGTFQTPQSYPVAGDAASVAVADVNNDGRPDLIVAMANDFVGVLLNDTCADFPPVVTLVSSPSVLWPPNGKMISMTLSGTITAAPCATTPTVLSYTVVDEYGLVQPAGSIVPDSDGTFSVSLQLQASRRGDDRNGRQYAITVTATTNSGASASAVSIVTVPHNR
jgi:hypothetical protein